MWSGYNAYGTYVGGGGGGAGSPQPFLFFGFVLYDLVQNMRIDENTSDQCVNARTIYSKCHISNLTNSLKHETRDRGHRASLLSLWACRASRLSHL